MYFHFLCFFFKLKTTKKPHLRINSVVWNGVRHQQMSQASFFPNLVCAAFKQTNSWPHRIWQLQQQVICIFQAIFSTQRKASHFYKYNSQLIAEAVRKVLTKVEHSPTFPTFCSGSVLFSFLSLASVQWLSLYLLQCLAFILSYTLALALLFLTTTLVSDFDSLLTLFPALSHLCNSYKLAAFPNMPSTCPGCAGHFFYSIASLPGVH